MEILIFCGIYLVELVCYLVVLRMLFDVHIGKRIWVIAGIMMPVTIGILMPFVMLILPVNAAGKNVLITISVMMVVFVSLEGQMIEKGVYLVLALLLLECVDGIFAHPCELFFSVGDGYIRNFKYLAVKFCAVTSMVLLNIIKEKINQYKKIQINSLVYFVIGIIVASMRLCLGVLNSVKIYLPDRGYRIICNILNVSILISILLLVVFVVYIKNTHERMKQLLKTEQLLKESQVNYYKQILKKETDTRKYRHDMVNHLIYIQDLLCRNKIDDAQNYLCSILGGFKKIQKTYYVVGNEMVDTIMNYFFGMIPKNIEIIIKGKCPVKIDVEDTDVCTIFSNLFQNVVEEVVGNNIEDAKIMVHVQKGKQFVKYEIKNSLHREFCLKCDHKNSLPMSHKMDKINHGIGMVNVKETIERNYGKFEWYQKDGYFCVEVILPIQ